MALTVSQYRTMRDLFRGALSVDFSNPTDGDVLAFFKQLLTDASGAAALSNVRQFLAGEIARRVLSGNFSNPTDANVVDFWTALASDSNAVAAMGTTTQYRTMRQALVGAFSCDFFNPTLTDMLSYFSTYAVSGPIAILGSAPAWWVDASAGTLVDAGGGLASSWTDSSGNGVNFTFGAGQRPTIATSFLNSKTVARFDATTFGSAAYTSPTPGTQASYLFAVFRLVSNIPSSRLLSLGSASGASAIYVSAGPSINDYNGLVGGFTNNLTLGTWYRLEVYRSNSASDYVQANGAGASVNPCGNTAQVGNIITLNGDAGGGNNGNADIAEFFEWIGTPTAPQRAQLAAYSLAKWGV